VETKNTFEETTAKLRLEPVARWQLYDCYMMVEIRYWCSCCW